ncbi:MAG: universal stress protein [Rhodospirillales bacterium]|nr:universal stress protein [Rhodospirillales bacterium]
MTSAKHKLLVPSDGSPNAGRALDHAIGLVRAGFADELHLLNVQPSVGGAVATFVGRAEIRSFHHDEGMKALAAPKARAEQAGIAAKPHIGVGTPGPTIAAFARELGCDQIVMGTRGLGAAAGLLLGSVTTEVLRQTDIPVTLVK